MMSGLEALIFDIFRLLMLLSALLWPPALPSVQRLGAQVLQGSQHCIMSSMSRLVTSATRSALTKTAKGLGMGKTLRSQKVEHKWGEHIVMMYQVNCHVA